MNQAKNTMNGKEEVEVEIPGGLVIVNSFSVLADLEQTVENSVGMPVTNSGRVKEETTRDDEAK